MDNKERDIQLTEISITHSSKTDMYIPEKYRCLCNNNLLTKKGQNCQMFKIISVAVIPIVFLIGQSLVSIMNDVESLAQHKSVRGDISFSVDIGFLVHLLQLERGTTALYISWAKLSTSFIMLTKLWPIRKTIGITATEIILNI
jgi:hypothetical protein